MDVRVPVDKIAEKASGEPEINSQPFGNGKYPLPVWDFGHNFVKQPVSENQCPLLVAGWAASALLAGERDKKLLSAFGAAHTGKAILKVSALHELVNSLPDNRPPEPEPHFVTTGIGLLKQIEVFLNQPVERR
jgi:hypothetical protein